MHREAQYYAISPLLDSLEDIQPLTGEKVRQAFLDLLPYYRGTCTACSFSPKVFDEVKQRCVFQTTWSVSWRSPS